MIPLALVLSRTFHALLLLHPLLIISVLIGVEELGVPSPVPGDLMMLYAGVLVAQHRAPL